MKLQIDTSNKTIKLEQSAKLTELFTIVKKLLPNDEWKDYTIEAVTVINNWTNPFYTPFTYTDQVNPLPKYEITCGSNSETLCIESN